MDLSAEEVVKGLLSEAAYATPSDNVRVEDLEMKLPKWFDEAKFNQGRRFFSDFCIAHTLSLISGFIAVLAVPTVIKVMIGTQRSNTPYTAYKRYLSTYLHIITWASHDLKPGSPTWRSLNTVRARHVVAGRAARLKKQGTVSQRDLALTMLGLIGFSVLKPDKFHLVSVKKGDMEAFLHFWAVIGAMIGCQDRYNICRKTYDETYQVCQELVDRVLLPCLENVPEYFEHTARVLIDGGSAVFSFIDGDFIIYWTKHLANVPGYIYTEEERLALQRKLKKFSTGADKNGRTKRRHAAQAELRISKEE
ncbi:uncharacterized protein LOC126978584 isoform X2 [Leptidea sinapis]|uniref:uncharacterized protein LOC126978584 isoform X2 n=1 Tax=Leptidea sinapis TaxID=189913 RepID=UPI0021C49119|nr:uncharacterized protein LOC126978584 isoform X2 [Leptidea sinapis]